MTQEQGTTILQQSSGMSQERNEDARRDLSYDQLINYKDSGEIEPTGEYELWDDRCELRATTPEAQAWLTANYEVAQALFNDDEAEKRAYDENNAPFDDCDCGLCEEARAEQLCNRR